MFKNYNHLGFNNPYYFKEKGEFKIYKSFSKAVAEYSSKLTFDSTAAIEILNKYYSFADRTLAKEINKTPWQAKPNHNNTGWIYNSIPKHGNKSLSETEIAKILFEKICDEILLYTKGKTRIGILLSGGMDSRMVAGSIDYLIKNKQLNNVEVTGLTWGNDNSRDVVYAKKIANRLGWDWKHYKVTAKDFIQNIEETAIHGCEYSPLHLHAIPQIRNDNMWDVILGGSYGDSIGRAEYGSVNVENVKSLSEGFFNVASLVKDDVFENNFSSIEEDLKSYHTLFPKDKLYMQNELDYQIHYMRRMLNPCMELLAENSDFFQVFTHPSTFGFMWSLSPSCRNDLVYKEMMKHFSTTLDDIPWARTGLKYGETAGKPDRLSNRHHNYIEVIQKEILGHIKELALSKELNQLGVFNMHAIKTLIKLVKKKPYNSMYYLEQLSWLASVGRMAQLYSFKSTKVNSPKNTKLIKKRILKEYLPRFYRNRVGHYLRKYNLLK